MFTGLISERGVVRQLQAQGMVWRLAVEAPRLLATGLRVGDSVAVNGICLTVVELRTPVFFAEAVSETLAKTTLGAWQVGDKVNLERALQLSDRLDGHMVAGHVDGVARVQSVQAEGEARRVRFQAPSGLMHYIAAKGSVALDGISLTVAEVLPGNGFEIALIPHTLSETTGQLWSAGSSVNLEVDLIARYLERLGNFSRPGDLSLEKMRGAGF